MSTLKTCWIVRNVWMLSLLSGVSSGFTYVSLFTSASAVNSQRSVNPDTLLMLSQGFGCVTKTLIVDAVAVATCNSLRCIVLTDS